MTLEQLEETLPNGFHDAQIRSIRRDFEKQTLTLEVRILIGLPDDPSEVRDRYRNGAITFTGVELFVIESPEAESAFVSPGTVWFSVGRIEAGLFSADIMEKLVHSTLMYSFFILDWHSHIHIAASALSFIWQS